jgi:hypothetical protein
LRKELHDDSPSLIPHPKKSKRVSLKVKERVRKPNQTAEERQIAKSKDNEKHICTYTQTKKKKNTMVFFFSLLQEGPAATPAPPGTSSSSSESRFRIQLSIK